MLASHAILVLPSFEKLSFEPINLYDPKIRLQPANAEMLESVKASVGLIVFGVT